MECNTLLFFSEIKIIFFLFPMFKYKKFDKVSIVSPDFDITIKSVLFVLFFFLKFKIFCSSMLSKKNIFFLFFFLRNYKLSLILK